MARKVDPTKRERLLDIAAELFLAKGYDAATMQELADLSGLHKSSLYYYFRSKEDLLKQLTSDSQSKSVKMLDKARLESEDGDALIVAISLAIEQTLTDVARVSLVLRQKPGSDIGDEVIARRREYDIKVTALINEAQKHGKVRDDIPAALLARLILGMVSWLVEWYRPDRTRYKQDVIRKAILSILETGILVNESN
jgi:AcrR family transcriptional regulator